MSIDTYRCAQREWLAAQAACFDKQTELDLARARRDEAYEQLQKEAASLDEEERAALTREMFGEGQCE